MERSNLVRTAADLERKYDFSQLKVLKKNYELNKLGLNKVENEINNFVKATTKHLEELQNQVDGNITTWFYNGVPTIENNPAINWSTENEKVNHLGDLYYDQNTGYAYRWAYENENFVWSKIVDADVVKALAVANAAQDTADKKRQVFIEQPSPPYDVGDLWIKDNELYRCQTTKDSKEIFEQNDWINPLKYTDDTVANQVGKNLTILSGTVTEIREDVDELNTTMTNTTSLVNEQGKKIGTLETKTSETSQTVDEISASVTKIGKEIIPTGSASGSSIYINDSSDNKLINFEIDGKSVQDGEPTPVSPIDIKTVGYENLFNQEQLLEANDWIIDNDYYCGTFSNLNTKFGGSTNGFSFSKSFKENTSYTINFDAFVTGGVANFKVIYTDDSVLNMTISNISNQNFNYVTANDKTISKIIGTYNSGGSNILYIKNILLLEGIDTKNYIPYGKYGIEVETVGKNLFDINTSIIDKIVDTNTGILGTANGVNTSDFIKVAKDENYMITSITTDDTYYYNWYIALYDKNKKYISRQIISGLGNKVVSLIPQQTGFIRFSYNASASDIMFCKGTIAQEYEQHQSIKRILLLDESLKSLPNGVQDKVYIKNNTLYVDRKVGSIIFTGDSEYEAWGSFSYTEGDKNFRVQNNLAILNIKLNPPVTPVLLSDRFAAVDRDVAYIKNVEGITQYSENLGTIFISADADILSTKDLAGWLAYLADNNVRVDYELSEPYTENLGEAEMPGTYKNVTHIYTTDNLEPILNIEYVRDTTLSNYVEGQIGNAVSIQERKFAELEITTDRIQATVSEVSTNLNNNYTPTEELDQILEEQKNIIATEMTTKYQQDMSSFSFEIIKKINEDGVTTLKNTMVSIDEKGIHTAKNNEDVVSLLDNKGVYVSDGPLKDDESNVLMKTDRDGAFFKASNTVGTIKEQDIIQKEKIDDEDFGVCQGWYWIGDEN